MRRMEETVGKLLTDQHKTIACAESCTGGLLTSCLTDVPGSSAYVMGSVVCYTNAIKERFAGVSCRTIAEHTAISAETAKEMAEGIRKRIGTDIGVGISGLAGPGGSEDGRQAGLVYIAVSGSQGTTVCENHFRGDRCKIKQKSVEIALQMIHDYLSGGTF